MRLAHDSALAGRAAPPALVGTSRGGAFSLFPLWKVFGGPLEFLAVGWLFLAALSRAAMREREEIKEAPPGFEPGMADLQSAALAAWRRGRLSSTQAS